MKAAIDVFPSLIVGAKLTLLLTALSVAIGTAIGLFMGLFKMSANPLLRGFSIAYIDFFRGTPLLVQIFLWYFGILPLIFGTVDPFFAGVVACSVNCGAYTAEIVRAGIQSIDKGQMEAAMSLGLNYRQAMQYIILPQAFKVMIPPLINEFIAIMKDTCLVSAIAVEELFRKGQLYVATSWQPFWIYTEVAIMYLILYLVIANLGAYIERRLQTS
ncbi:MAG: amino acid ABC transporter permease [Ignavibacteriales bacterium]